MLGQFYSDNDEKFNVVILAGGLGTRMGTASDYIPKALTSIGSQRAIDLMISKFLLIANRFVVGTGWHADLLESYIKGRYPNLPVTFSREDVAEMENNGTSLLYALDQVDSRRGTIVSFCDLLMLSNPMIGGSAIYLAVPETKGVIGTFRHSVTVRDKTVERIEPLDSPKRVPDEIDNGVIGFFVFHNTILLKEIAYSMARLHKLTDITTDIVSRYVEIEKTGAVPVDALLEFGDETDLMKARAAWESY